MPEPINKALNANIPLPYAILLMLMGFGGSGGIGILTRSDDLSAATDMIRKAQADEMDHYRLLLDKLDALDARLDRMENRIDTISTISTVGVPR